MNVGGEGSKYSNKFYSKVRRHFFSLRPSPTTKTDLHFLFSLDKLHTGDWRGTASIAIEAKDTIAAIFDSLYMQIELIL